MNYAVRYRLIALSVCVLGVTPPELLAFAPSPAFEGPQSAASHAKRPATSLDSGPVSPPTAPDAEIFREVILALLATQQQAALRVDPRPVRSEGVGPEAGVITATITPVHMEAPPTVVEGRKAALQALGVAETDNATSGNCPGLHVLPPPAGRPDPRASYCPTAPVRLAAIGLPKRIDNLPTALGAVGEHPEAWVTRVVLTTLTAQGFLTAVEDITLRQVADGWKVIGRRNLVTVE